MSNNAAPVAGVERVGSKEKRGEPVSSQSQNVHFRTYGTDDYAWAKGRIVQESLDTGWFASVKALGPDDLTAEFKKSLRLYLSYVVEVVIGYGSSMSLSKHWDK